MKDTEYHAIQVKLFEAMHAVEPLDLKGFLAAIGRAESVGHILDPTLYRGGVENLQVVKRMATALRDFQKSIPSGEERATMITRIAKYQAGGV
jgi:hypothetical protein